MAGKTLPGIGDDESGEHEAGDVDAADRSGPSRLTSPDAPTVVRTTDRMPLSMPVASFGGPTLVDDDKVAEGLKRLRSLDEPLGSLPTPTTTATTPTMK